MSSTAPRRITLLTVARAVALIIAAIMTVYFVVTDAVRSDNPFLVPDMALTVALFVSALLPQRLAAPAFIYSFGWAAGVFTTSMCNHIINGRFPVDHVILLLFCTAIPALLARDLIRSQTAGSQPAANRPEPVGAVSSGLPSTPRRKS